MSGVVCGHCGAGNRENELFCANCGEFLDWDGASAGTGPKPTPDPNPEPEPGRRAPTPPGASSAAGPPTIPPGPGRRPAPPSDTPLRPPAEQRPAVRSHPAPVDPAARATTRLLPVSPTLAPVPTSRHCPACGSDNDHARRFCGRCGEWLVTPSVAPALPPARFKEKWRRRWFGEGGPYTGRLSRATIGFRALVGLVLISVLTAVLALAGLHPIQRVKDELGHIRGTGKMTGLTAAGHPAGIAPPAGAKQGGAATDRTAAWAVDNVRARGWTTRWTSATAGDPDAACRPVSGATPAAAMTSTSLTIRFPSAAGVREIGFAAGLVKPAERTGRWQPRTLELRWEGGECQSVTLDDTADLQRFDVSQPAGDAAGLTGVTITIVAGFRPTEPSIARLDLGEVTLWHR